jgi:hypothetical protein
MNQNRPRPTTLLAAETNNPEVAFPHLLGYLVVLLTPVGIVIVAEAAAHAEGRKGGRVAAPQILLGLGVPQRRHDLRGYDRRVKIVDLDDLGVHDVGSFVLGIEDGAHLGRYPDDVVGLGAVQRQPHSGGEVQIEGGQFRHQSGCFRLFRRYGGEEFADGDQRLHELQLGGKSGGLQTHSQHDNTTIF